MTVANLESTLAGPFPGLRPFEKHEAPIFFGRGLQVDDMIRRLEDHRFLPVVGSSGCGKSSLVRAGLLPALDEGELFSTGDDWLMVIAKPGASPFRNLAEAWSNAQASHAYSAAATSKALQNVAFTEAVLQSGPLGLLELIDDAGIPPARNVLLLIDQFEEIFRFRYGDEIGEGHRSAAASDEANAFVSLLLASAQQARRPVYVMLTMRSDFLGDTNAFHGLPEAINDSQFLAPRMTQAQIRQAIVGPLQLFGAAAEPALVNRIIGDVGNDPDQLPLMQHVLMRMWNQAQLRSSSKQSQTELDTVLLTVSDYSQLGGVQAALSNHAAEVFEELKRQGDERIVEMLFRSLRQRGDKGQEIRCPATIENIAATIEDDVSEPLIQDVIRVADTFRRPACSFLMPPLSRKLSRSTLIDISHESLIRRWKQMHSWANNEDESAEMLDYLVRSAKAYEEQTGELLERKNLERVSEWQARAKPTQRWAQRYVAADDFERAARYLRESRNADEARRESEKQQEEKELLRAKQETEIARRLADAEKARADLQTKRTLYFRRIMIGIAFLLLVSTGLAGFAFYQWSDATRAKKRADDSLSQAKVAKDKAEESTKLAEKEKLLADEAKKIADEERLNADDSRVAAFEATIFSLGAVNTDSVKIVLDNMKKLALQPTKTNELELVNLLDKKLQLLDDELKFLDEKQQELSGDRRTKTLEKSRMHLGLLALNKDTAQLPTLLGCTLPFDVAQAEYVVWLQQLEHLDEDSSQLPLPPLWTEINDGLVRLEKLDAEISDEEGRLIVPVENATENDPADEFPRALDEKLNELNERKLLVKEIRQPVARTAAFLAKFDAESEQWGKIAARLMVALTKQEPAEFKKWSELLQPVSGEIEKALLQIYEIEKDKRDQRSFDKKGAVDSIEGANAKALLTFFGRPPATEASLSDSDLVSQVEGMVWIELTENDPLGSSFYIGMYEITQQQYELASGKNPSQSKNPRGPVTNVNWKDATDFCQHLNNLDTYPPGLELGKLPEGFEYSLPTQAQWKYAASDGGKKMAFTDEGLDKVAYSLSNLRGQGRFYDGPTTVGSREPNEFGIYDMLGNVAEWCLDSDGPTKWLLGGSYFDKGTQCQPSSRVSRPPSTKADRYGFRIVAVKNK